MSHAILRGKANPAQLYLDGILESILELRGEKDRSKVSLSEVLFFCMKRSRTKLFMINGATDESITNEQILKMSVAIARALINRGVKGNPVMLMLRNHQYMAAVYYGVLFAGAIPFMIDPNSTMHELNHFKTLTWTSVVFCEKSCVGDVTRALNDSSDEKPDIVIADNGTGLQHFIAGHSDNIDNFRLSDDDYELPIMMLPTSGSTGLPKAAELNNRGLVAQLPTLWTYHTQFPRPTNIATLISTAQWMTHTCLMTTCPVYEVTLLMTPTSTIDCLLTMIRRHKPTWTLLGPAFANSLAAAASLGELTSFQTVLTTGAQPSLETVKALKEKLSEDVHLCNGYGMTEGHGFIAVPDPSASFDCTGKILNVFEYKLVDDTGSEVGTGENGELIIRSDLCILKSYHKNEEAYQECMTGDRWWKTGDIFYQNDEGLMFFVERKKFWFKYLNYHISPEELEAVIGNVPGVQECVVCETPKGPAAGVVKRRDCNINEEDISDAVYSKFFLEIRMDVTS